MVEREVIRVISSDVDAAAALLRIAGMTGGVTAAIEKRVVYPYFLYKARCSVPTLGGTKSMSVDCLVDGINGHGATADNFGTQQSVVAGEMRLPSKISDDDALRIARRTITHALGRKTKMIADFDVQLEACGTVYKRFWIVRVGKGKIMIDGVTGNMFPLGAVAA